MQIKTLKNPDGAYQAMKTALDKLVASSPTPSIPLKLHILKKPGTSSGNLENALNAYINSLDVPVRSRITFEVESFELSL